MLIVDDLIATGGTLLRGGGAVSHSSAARSPRVAAVIDLPELGGSAALRADGLTVHTLCTFSEHE